MPEPSSVYVIQSKDVEDRESSWKPRAFVSAEKEATRLVSRLNRLQNLASELDKHLYNEKAELREKFKEEFGRAEHLPRPDIPKWPAGLGKDEITQEMRDERQRVKDERQRIDELNRQNKDEYQARFNEYLEENREPHGYSDSVVNFRKKRKEDVGYAMHLTWRKQMVPALELSDI